jgi:N-acetylglucosaminyl-diphospho-decaprenol L-rhamnosyltransferase
MTMNETPMRHQPTLAIITVSYNSGRYLPDFLASTREASADASDVVVVVADNRSDDVAEARRTTEDAGAVFVDVGTNAGYGTAVNVAAATLPPSVRHVLVSNPDVVLSPGSVDVLRRALVDDRRVAAVGPAVLEPDGEVYPSARSVPSLRTGLGHALFANVWPANPWTQRYHRSDDDSARTTGWLSGACLLIRRDVFDELGGFDDGYFMYFEDVDLGWRIGRAGFRNLYEPAAQVMHVGAHATRDSSDAMRLEHHRSAYRFLSRKYAAWWAWPLRVGLRAGLALRARLHG